MATKSTLHAAVSGESSWNPPPVFLLIRKDLGSVYNESYGQLWQKHNTEQFD